MDGYVNVDKEAAAQPDMQVDLETFPWPFKDNSVKEIHMSHVLEHLGRDPQVFLAIMKELYRICAPDTRIVITVPHPRHDHFLIDPTHVRPVLPETMDLFSKKLNREWSETGASNTPFGFYLDVDFQVEEVNLKLDEQFEKEANADALSHEHVIDAMRIQNNVVKQITMTLRVLKS